MAEIYGKVKEHWTRNALRALVTIVETGEVVPTDAAGRFSLRSVEQGRVHLRFEADGHTPVTVSVDAEDPNQRYPVEALLKPVVRALSK